MRKDSEATRYPGVRRVEPGLYRVRAKVRNLEVDRVVETATPAEASAIREQLRRELAERVAANTTGAAPPKECFADFAADWLHRKKATKRISEATADRYEDALVHILTPHGDGALGVMDRSTITKSDVERWLGAMAAKARPSTVNTWLSLLKQILGDACEDLGIRNPAAKIRALPTETLEDRERAPVHYTPDELRSFLETYEKAYPQWFPLVLLCVTTGLRFGEATALRWTDLDRETGILHVERSHVRKRLKLPKTAKGIRTVALHSRVLAVLDEHRRRLVREQHPGLTAGLIFPNANGDLQVNSSAVNRATKLVLNKLRMNKRRVFHGLRHTANALFARHAEGAVVRAQMGHATARMTDHYNTAWMPEQQAMVAGAFAGILREGGDAAVGTSPESTKAS